MKAASNVRTGEVGKIVLGCGIVVAVGILVCGGLVAYLGPKMMDKGVAMLEKELDRQQLLADWTPPADDVTAEELLPKQVSTYTRSTAPDEISIDDLNVEKTFHHAEYESGGDTYTVYIDQASADEKTLVFTQLKEKLDNIKSGTKFSLGTENSNSFYYYYDPPGVTGTAYYGKGWLILAVTDGADDTMDDFLRNYIDAIEGESVEPAAELEVDESPAGEAAAPPAELPVEAPVDAPSETTEEIPAAEPVN